MEQIAILDSKPGEPNEILLEYLLWLPVNTPNPNPNANSIWPGAPADIIDALRAGTIIERQYVRPFPVTLPLPSIEEYLLCHYQVAQAYQQGLKDPGQFTGTIYDGVKWNPPQGG